jgi:hypothetical protein
VNLTLTEEQQEIVRAAERLLARRAAADGYDHALEHALGDAGFARGLLPLEAALVAETLARHAGCVAFAAAALVAPGLGLHDLPGPIALTDAADSGPVRFGGEARSLLIVDGASARMRALAPGEAAPCRTSAGYPMARVPRDGGNAVDAERLRAWWRVALAVELAGTMRAALDLTIDYVTTRRQFGRAIGSFQALQHRLAECAVLVEGARLLALEAAGTGAPVGAAAVAAGYASAAAARLFQETHQLHGAIGFTREHPLHRFTLRLQALRLELGGASAHRRAVAEARWP